MSHQRYTFVLAAVLLLSGLAAGTAPSHSSYTTQEISDVTAHLSDNLTGRLYYPRCSDPVFATPGGTFTLQIRASGEARNATDFGVELATAYEPVVDDYTLAVQSFNTSNDDVFVTVIVPSDAHIELYNLTVRTTIDHTAVNVTQPRAVDVIASFNDSFTLVTCS